MADHIGYGAPGTQYSYPHPPSYYSPPIPNSAPNFSSAYTQAPQSSAPPLPSEYIFASAASTGSHPEASAPLYTPEPPLHSLTEPDPSYSPRVPEYDGGFEFLTGTGTSSPYASAWEHQKVSNISSGYNAADNYNPGGYSSAATRWSYDREEAPVYPPPSVSGYDNIAPPQPVAAYDHQASAPSVSAYDHQTPPPSVSGYDHIAPQVYDHKASAPSAATYDHQVSPPSGSWYNSQAPTHTSGYDYRAPSYLQPVPEKPYVEATNGRSDYSKEYPGVYAYDGGNTEPYGAKGTGASTWNPDPLGDFPKLAKALPKVQTESTDSGIGKFHVKVLDDSSLPTNVVCQIGLDGIRLLDPSSSKVLRIHPLESITSWVVEEPSTFVFWTSTGVNVEERVTTLRSSKTTINTILDTLMAACVQASEIDKSKSTSTPAPAANGSTEGEKKSFFSNWFNVAKAPPQEEKDHWVPDAEVMACKGCNGPFTALNRRHHCRNCGDIFCEQCSRGRTALTKEPDAPIVRVCDHCLAEITHALTNSKGFTYKIGTAQQTHEDLAKKLKEEMERNASRKSQAESDRTTSKAGKCNRCGSNLVANQSKCSNCGSDSSRNGTYKSLPEKKRTKEVACPTCTVHLEVEVPSYGVDTVECGVCQHPFIVKA